MQRGGVLDHQHGRLLQALPGRVTGETLLQGGGPHPRVGQEARDPFGLSPAARGLRDGIARPLRERCQDAGQAGRKPFVRQHRSRCHPRCPECVHMHSASPTRYQSVLSAAPFLLSTPYPLSRSRSSQKLWVMLSYGHWVQSPRRQAQGPAPKPRWMPLPGLLYAQVVKTVRRRRLVDVQHRVVLGTLEAVNHVLAPLGWHINTAFVERINLTIRQHVAAVGRRVITLCKGEDGLRQQLAVFHCYYNFCLPHASLRQPLPQPEPTHGGGSAKQWRPQTPAVATASRGVSKPGGGKPPEEGA